METSTWGEKARPRDLYPRAGTSEGDTSIIQSKEELDKGSNAPCPTTPDSSFTPIDEDKEKGPNGNPPSDSSSTDVEAPVVVPRLKRRGICGQFTLVAEVENPRTYLRSTKWFLTFVVALAASAAPMGGIIIFRTCIS
jgi:hypothetical protein